MAAERRRTPKTESLTIRLDPKTRFMLEMIAKMRGQTITTVVERAIHEAATSASFWSERQRENIDWRNLWDVSDGVRALQMAREPAVFPSYEEERRLAFADEHWPFFYTADTRKMFRRAYLDILWPRIDEFVQMHVDGRSADYFGAGNAMAKALLEAGVAPPEWPPGKSGGGFSSGPRQQSSSPREDFTADLDDEIPF